MGNDLFSTPAPQVPSALQHTVFDDANLKIVMESRREGQATHMLKALFTNNTQGPISGISISVAVQKYLTL